MDGPGCVFGKIQPESRVRFERLERLRPAPMRDRTGPWDRSIGFASTVPTPKDEQLRPVSYLPAQAYSEQAATYGAANSPSRRIWQGRARQNTGSNRATRAD